MRLPAVLMAAFGLLLALLLAACGGSGDKASTAPNATLEAALHEAQQTPVEDYVSAYAHQLCGPIATFFEDTADLFDALDVESTPAEEFDLSAFDALAETFGQLEGPYERLIEDAKKIDPPEELAEYHDAAIEQMEYALESIKALGEAGFFGAFLLPTPPASPEEPAGLNAAFVVECQDDLAGLVERMGPDILQFDLGEGGLFGDDFAEETPAPPVTGSVGEAIQNGDFELTVLGIEDPYDPGAPFEPTPGTRWVVIEVSITNVSADTQSVSDFDFRLKDADDFEYDTTFLSGPLPRALSSGSILPGDTVRGQIAFEVAEDAAAARLIYDPSFFGEGRIDIELR